tara:strand:- start:6920 stop:7765 length:846 start_codon:yes stop_codon:yes gene_type:complete
MEFFKTCNGCGSAGLKDINSNNLQICNNCLLISRKFNDKLRFTSQETFKGNKEYEWELKNFKCRSEKNYYFFKQILNFTKFNKKDEILDFGSGYGSLIEILQKKKYKVTGLEPSVKNFRISKKRGHKVINEFLKNNTFKSNRFKLIVSLFVFTYVYDIADKFKIFRKILKKDGYLLIHVHQFKFSSSFRKKNKIVSEVVANQFSNQSLKNLFNIHNFQIIFFNAKIGGTTIIAKKLSKTKKYKKTGNIYFEIFYFKCLLYFISQIMFILLNIKVKIRNIFK